jgi:chloramphenicol-sensitive protein RarD
MSDARPIPLARPDNEDSLGGFLYALGAYFMWGFLPIYMKMVAHISPVEVVAHRVLWSLPIAAGIIWALGRTNDLRAALRAPKMLGMAAITAMLVSINWGIYVWAIGSGQALEAALGYYINPLFSVALGATLLGERLNRVQMAAIALATLAVAMLTWEAGRLPLVALSLTVSWAAYAFFKRSLPIGPNQGFFLEVMLLSPIAFVYVIWVQANGHGHFLTGLASDTALLLGCGVVTAVPLMVYANGAKRLRLSTIGIMQYITPTMIFLLAVLVFKEPFGGLKLVAFPMIWLAQVIYSWGLFRQARARAG